MPIKVIRRGETLPKVQTVNVLIFGDHDSGKSTLGSAIDDAVFIDTNQGAHRAGIQPNILVPVNTYQDIIDLSKLSEWQSLRKEAGIVVIDTINNLLDRVFTPMIHDRKPELAKAKNSMQFYGELYKQFKAWYSLIQQAGFSIVFVAHKDKGDTHGDRKVWYEPKITGQTKNEILGDCDAVAYMYSKKQNNQDAFYLSFTGDFHEKKNPMGFKGIMPVPNLTYKEDEYFHFANNLVPSIVSALNKKALQKQETGAKRSGAYEKALAKKQELQIVKDTFGPMLEQANTPSAINDIVKKFRDAKQSKELNADQSTYGLQLLMARVKELAYTYDKATQSYVDPNAQANPAEQPAKQAKQAELDLPAKQPADEVDLNAMEITEGMSAANWVAMVAEGMLESGVQGEFLTRATKAMLRVIEGKDDGFGPNGVMLSDLVTSQLWEDVLRAETMAAYGNLQMEQDHA